MSNHNHNHELAQKSSALAGDASAIVDEVKEQAKNLGAELKQQACNTSAVIKDKTIATQNQLEELIHAHPYKSLGLAFIAGLIVARCWKS